MIAALLIAAAASPCPAAQSKTSESPPPQASERLDAWLAEVDLLQAADDLAGARSHLQSLMSSEVHAALSLADSEVLLSGLESIDERAVSLNLLRIQAAVREERLRILTGTLSDEHPDRLAAAQSLAQARLALADFESAHALCEQVLRIREARLPEDHPDLIDARFNWATSSFFLGDVEGAHAMYRQLYEAAKRLLPEDHPELLELEQALGGTFHTLGDLHEASRLLEHVHQARESALPADHEDLLAIKLDLASTRIALGDLRGALALDEHVHDAWERLLPDEHPDLLLAKQNLAVTLSDLGEFERAKPLHEYVHASRERLLPADHPDLLDAKANLAGTLYDLGDYQGALVMFEAVHTASERLFPAHESSLLTAKLNLASTHAKLGDLPGALALLEHVHAVRQRRLPADHPDLLTTKSNLATTRSMGGDIEGALTLAEEVHAIRERVLPADHPRLLSAKSSLAALRFIQNDLDEALELYRYVEEVLERSLPPEHPDMLNIHHSLSATLHAMGRLPEAFALAEAVLAERESLLPEDHRELTRSRYNLALMRHAAGEYSTSLELRQAIVQALPALLERAAAAPPREARQGVRSAVQWLAKARFSAPIGQAELTGPTFEVLETARVVVSLPFRVRREPSSGFWASTRRDLRLAEEELDRLVASGPSGYAGQPSPPEIDPLDWKGAIQAAALRRDQAQRKLLGTLHPSGLTRVTAESIARTLKAGALAAGLTKLDRWHWDGPNNRCTNLGSYYLAHVVTPAGRLHEIDLGPASFLDELVEDWRARLGAPVERGVGVRMPRRSEVEAGRILRRALVDPLLDAAGPEDAWTTLHLCLDDVLFAVPVEALPLDQEPDAANPIPGDVMRLGDRIRILYEPSMARLLEPAGAPEGDLSVLAVGALDYSSEEVAGGSDSDPLARLSSWGSWDRLSATDAEIRELAYQADSHLGIEAQLLRGKEVTESSLAEAVRGKRYVHLATHGWFLPRTARKSLLDDEPGEEHALLGNRETVTGFAPWTLCGLVLSGANAAQTDAERSARLLTAQELAGFDLRACELAVLSACETHVGIARAGQGIQSLQTALHSAGARSSITSLWAVQDWPTQSLMKRFYDNLWQHGMTKADALWAAKCSLRAGGHPPRVWAGWILSGDPE